MGDADLGSPTLIEPLQHLDIVWIATGRRFSVALVENPRTRNRSVYQWGGLVRDKVTTTSYEDDPFMIDD